MNTGRAEDTSPLEAISSPRDESGTDSEQKAEESLSRPSSISASRKRVHLVVSVLGMVLLVAALVIVFREMPDPRAVILQVRSAPPWLLGLLLLAMVLSLLFNGLTFMLLTRRHAPIGLLEMTSVASLAWLLNYLPLSPGMPARLGYHKVRQGMTLVQTGKTLIEFGLSTTLAVFLVIGSVVLSRTLQSSVIWPLLGVGSICALAWLAPQGRFWGGVMALRLADVLIWALRSWAAFSILRAPISLDAASAIAAAGYMTSLLPFVSNGMGIREWATGLLSPWLSAIPLGMGLTAEVLSRLAELVVMVPAGLLAGAYLSRLTRGSSAQVFAAGK